MSERTANRGVAAAAAVLVALCVAGLWFWLGDSSEPQQPKASAPSRSVSPPSRSTRAAPPQKTPSSQARPQTPPDPDSVLEVEVLSKNQPLPGAQVQVYERQPADLSILPAQWFGRDSGTTGADGRWELPTAPGSYFVTARADGLAPGYATVVHPPGSARTRVQLRLEEGVELVGFTLDRATGEPVSLSEILLTPPAFASGERGPWDAPEEERLVATSNELGEFRFSGLAPGRYRLEARAPGYASTVLPSTPIPFKGRATLLMIRGGQLEGTVVGTDGQPAAGAEVLALSGEQVQSMFSDSEGHFSLAAPPGSYALSARKGPEAGALEEEVKVDVGQRVQGLRLQLGAGAWLSGKLVRKDGSGVLGARVEAWPRGLSAATSQIGTDESGAFAFPALAAGTYTLHVFLPGFQSFPPWFNQFAHGPVTLASGEHTSLTLTVDDGPSGIIECRVRDASNHPVRDVQLRASLLPPQGASSPRAFEGRTDATGRFTFTGLPAGRYHVAALREGRPLSAELNLILGKHSLVGACDFPGVPSETAPDGYSSTVEGQVLQRSGGPPDDAVRIELIPHEKRGFYRDRILVEAQGRFRLTVPAGSYTLKAFRQRAIGCGAAGQRELQVEAGQHLETTLLLEEPPEPSLQLRVLEADGAPARLTVLMIHTPESYFPTAALTDEQARLDVCLPPAKQPSPAARLLTVSTPDGARAAQAEAASGVGELTLQLRSLPVLQGRVLHPQGLPVRHVILDILPAGLMGARTYEFVGDRFEIPDFPLGPRQLIVTADGLRASLVLELQPEEHKVLELPVYPGVSMTGRLVDATTRQPVRAWVSLPTLGDQPSDSDGRFSFRDLPAGELFLTFARSSRDRSVLPPQPVKLSPGQDTDVGDIAVHMP